HRWLENITGKNAPQWTLMCAYQTFPECRQTENTMKRHRLHFNRRSLQLPSAVLRGTPISPGYAQGLVHVQRDPVLSQEDMRTEAPFNAETEFGRLDSATIIISN